MTLTVPETDAKNISADTITLISTKLRTPQSNSDLINRPELIERLKQNQARKVTLVSAPAGYGKTTLVTQWLDTKGKNYPANTAWLSLSENDNDLAVFLSYFVAAIQSVFPHSCQKTKSLLQVSTQLPPVDYIASSLINEIAALSKISSTYRFSLILDDYHYITEATIHQLIGKLIEHQPEQFHLFLISRQDPFQLPLGQLRAKQQIAEIRQADLRFNLAETKTFLSQALKTDLPDDLITTLDQWVEGWVVGLRMASLSMRNLDDPTTFTQTIRGTDRYIMEYLIDQVLSRQPKAVQLFVLKTSILNRLCGPLCEAVTGVDDPVCDGQAHLNWLEQTNSFLVSLDNHHEWYRYHHLFQDLLSSKLHAEFTPAQIANLHRRAERWFAKNGFVEEALRHALLANDVDAAVKLVEDNSHNLLNRLAWITIERWLAMLPEEIVWQRPKLLITQAWLRYRQFRISVLDAILDRAESALENSSTSPEEKQALLGHINTFRSVTATLLYGDSQKSVILAKQAMQQLPPSERGATGTALGYLALAQQNLGQTEVAVKQLKDATNDPGPFGPAKPQLFLGLAYVQLIATDLHAMLQTTQQALAFAAGQKHMVGSIAAHLVSGLLHYEWNNLDTATEHFSKVIDMRYGGNFFATFTCLLGQIKIHQAQGNLAEAQEILSSLRTDVMRIHNTHFLPVLDSMQAGQWLLAGNIGQALRWATTFNSKAFYEHNLLFEVPSLTRANILTAHGNSSEGQSVLSNLQTQLSSAETNHFTQRAIQILLHLALAHNRLQQKPEALDTLRQAIALAQPGGLIRTFADCGAALVPLLRELEQQDVAPNYLPQVLAAFPPDRPLPSNGKNPVDLLTRREEEILQLMQVGLTNQEIANKLVISLFTVKRHATNIYNKLAVSNRRQAVRKAQQLGILA